MIDVREHGGVFGGGLRPGYIDTLKDLKLDFPVEKKVAIMPGRFSGDYSCFDICGDYVLSSYYGDLVKLYRLNSGGLDTDVTVVATHTPPSGAVYTKFALGETYYAIANTSASPFEIKTYNLAGALIASKSFAAAILDIKSDGTYMYVLKADFSIEKYDSSLGTPIAVMAKPADCNAVNTGFSNLIIPKGNSHNYFYFSYQSTNYFVVSKRLKSTLEQAAVNNTTLPRNQATHMMGVDFEKGNVFIAQCNTNPYVSISILGSNLVSAWNSGTFDYNSGSASYISGIIVGKDEVYYVYKAQNGSYGSLMHARQNRATLTVRAVNSTSTMIPSMELTATHIALDIDQKKLLKMPMIHAAGYNGGTEEMNIGFYKI